MLWPIIVVGFPVNMAGGGLFLVCLLSMVVYFLYLKNKFGNLVII